MVLTRALKYWVHSIFHPNIIVLDTVLFFRMGRISFIGSNKFIFESHVYLL